LQPVGDLPQRDDVGGDACRYHCTWHAPHDRTRFVLHDDSTARGPHPLGPLGAVPSHAGEYARHDTRAIDGGRRTEQNIDRGPAVILRRLIRQTHSNVGALPPNCQVLVAGRNDDVTGLDELTVDGFNHMQGGAAVEARREQTGEQWRHVLNHENRDAEVTSQPGHDRAERVRTAGRRTNHDDVDAILSNR
jgi:hypothetical protein